jgi:hypothetical protein
VAFWIALVVFLAGLFGGLTYAVVRGIALWRRVKRTGSTFSAEAERISEVSAGIQAHLDRASASGARLGEVSARLAVSRAKLDVQLQAIREARHTMRRLLWFLPGV